ncbi:Fatty acid synthase beta subunit [Aspergillus mulundensis]|uniref:Fatty acid synthase beta subunit n=1 Tax=Aspergillus mulundensis TaxID=1810919 RepID=A0A3D8SL92_9EURO|nr:Fatty acid synthase beta subunit [Aspergillus mulundensis]RDW87105.1 Fatty acid synthase beta subunit [Aspergillus mulundensis]
MALEEESPGSRDLGPSTLRPVSGSSASPSSSSPFSYKDLDLRLPVPSSHIHLLEPHRNAFLASYSAREGTHSPLELALSFLDFLVTQQTVSPEVLSTVRRAFESEFLRDETEIHSLIADLTPISEERQQWLGIYYRFVEANDNNAARSPLSALLRHAKTNEFQLMAVFGGQGESSRTCVREFQELYASYKPMLRRFIGVVGPCLYDLSTRDEFRSYYKNQPLDLEAWIADSTNVPEIGFVASAPVSVPLIGTLSLARYCVTCYIAGCNPGEMRSMFRATTGHSQGLLPAIVIASSDSWDTFYQLVETVTELLFCLGWECHQAAPCSMVPAANYIGVGEANTPSYMMSIRGLEREEVEAILEHVNASLLEGKQLYLALVNAYDQFVIAGPVAPLLRLDNYIAEIASKDTDQTQTPFRERKPCAQHSFLPVSTPFHTPYLTQAAAHLKERFFDCPIHTSQLAIPVYHTGTGLDLRQQGGSALRIAIDAIATERCNWKTAVASYPASHILIFDRGGLAPLIKHVREGCGVRVLQACDLDPRDSEMATMRDLFAPKLLKTSTRLRSWEKEFQPRLLSGTKTQLETRLNRVLGAPPIIVAGMTPTTAHPDFVAAIINAGYHAELAGGGYHSPAAMETAIYDLARSISEGRGITCNLIYANPRSLSWQVDLIRRLSQSKVSIEGLTIGAGVPSLDVASNYIETLGLRHISFKPGSVPAIRQVIEIAQKYPTFPVILQWTGGRGGGHHSSEDFHAPILATYGTIRQHSNIYLVAGSGFGDSDSVYPYLSGSWSTAMGRPAMPFDGILLGSRMMVAKEAHTSPAARRIIVATPGVSDSEWERTYDGPAGGVITVTSEMGEPIHKIATRGVCLWAEMDKTMFSLSRSDRLTYLAKHRLSIIRRLNADFAKPWFGCNSNGDAVDLEEMTYFDVLKRTVSLMYVLGERWIDSSYTDFTMTMAQRWLSRLPFIAESAADLTPSLLQEAPDQFLAAFANACPTAKEDLLNPEDISFFLMQCKLPGRKPVNFIPALDDDFEFYFKKDSLWQAEDVDAVVSRDPERVCILHGPVAARYSNVESEPVGYILDCISAGVAVRLREGLTPEALLSKPESDFITPASWSTLSSDERDSTEGTSRTSITSLSDIVDDLSLSSGGVDISPRLTLPPWVRALLEDDFVLQGNKRQVNPFCWLTDATSVTVLSYNPATSELVIIVQDPCRTSSTMRAICYDGIVIRIAIEPPKGSEPLKLFYTFNRTNPTRLREAMEERNDCIRSFYRRLWFEGVFGANHLVEDTFHGPEITLTKNFLDEHLAITGSVFSDDRQMMSNTDVLPINAGVIIAWDVISRPLTLRQIGGDLLRLVHHSNTFEYSSDARLRLGDIVSSKSQVQAVYEDDAGVVVVVEAQIFRSGVSVMTIVSTFLFRGADDLPITSFRRVKEQRWAYDVANELDEAILVNRGWFQRRNSSIPLVGKCLTFTFETLTKYHDGLSELHVSGNVMSETNGQRHDCGVVEFEGTCTGNPVLDFLDRRGKLAETRTVFDSPGWTGKSTMKVQMPPNNEPYAKLSRDFNPIHTSPIFASLAGLPGTLCHGMLTSAIAERVLEHLGLEGDRDRLHRFDVRFVDMVMPSEKLIVKIEHTGMIEGRMCFGILVNRKESNERVLEADAEVEQPRTAYLFTGQGSQSKGMGMDLYESSPVARAVWDDIDQRLYDAYGMTQSAPWTLADDEGWSVLDIVRNNPKSLTIHFGGRKGRSIRQKYLDITTEVVLSDGQRVQKSVLAGLTSTSTSYTFRHPRGLLYSTQFAQPAILLFEAAAFAELRVKGYVSQGAMYAGHSLGEFGALSALSRTIPTGALVELAFYRGSVMQASVARDDQGSTTYGMVAVNPKRAGKFFTQSTLGCLVSQIATQSQELLEIVNFNIEGEQYVCSGTSTNLYVLGKLIDHISEADGDRLVQDLNELQPVINSLLAGAKALPSPIQLQRGKATVPLEGIDVPFHSSHLRSTVDRFRQCLLRPGFLVDNIDVEQLVGKYIPNVMARPFSLDREYFQEAFELTQSPVLGEILSNW